MKRVYTWMMSPQGMVWAWRLIFFNLGLVVLLHLFRIGRIVVRAMP